MTQITLPYPPALNNLFATVGKRRIRSKRYAAWCQTAGWEVRAQRPQKVTGPFNIVIVAERPDNRVRDLDGILKAPLDLLVSMGVIDGDHLAQQITVGWSPKAPAQPGKLIVTIEPVLVTEPEAVAA